MMTHDSVVFTSWKEIASYLGKGVRTVQRWEAQFGLPVQRPNSRAKGIVRASREELDQWMSTRWSSRSTKIEIPIPVPLRNPAEPRLELGIQVSRELHTAHRRLVDELQESLRALSQKCEGLALNMIDSQRLCSEPAIHPPKNGNSAKATNPQRP